MITLECNYSKKIGLPGYSSHQFSITLKTEISDLNQVQPESARLYTLLQNGVDSGVQVEPRGPLLPQERIASWVKVEMLEGEGFHKTGFTTADGVAE
jgi:hypothetical protein